MDRDEALKIVIQAAEAWATRDDLLEELDAAISFLVLDNRILKHKEAVLDAKPPEGVPERIYFTVRKPQAGKIHTRGLFGPPERDPRALLELLHPDIESVAAYRFDGVVTPDAEGEK